MILSQFACIH